MQIVKGWVTPDGTTEEKVFDVVCSDGLEVDPVTRRCPDNGAGVDPQSCETTGRGHENLCTVWQDPDYDASQRAFYYVRVVENPTCRWSTRQCMAAGVNPFDDNCATQAQAADEALKAADSFFTIGAVGNVYGRCCLKAENEPFYSPVIQERAWTSPIWVNPTKQ